MQLDKRSDNTQLAVSLGRIDINASVMTMPSFRELPRRGHLERAKRICGWLSKMKDGAIQFRTEEPDYSGLPQQIYDWSQSIYGNVK